MRIALLTLPLALYSAQALGQGYMRIVPGIPEVAAPSVVMPQMKVPYGGGPPPQAEIPHEVHPHPHIEQPVIPTHHCETRYYRQCPVGGCTAYNPGSLYSRYECD
jgi:hypothetical protein